MQSEQFANTVGVRQVRFGATVTQGDKEQPVRFCEKARRSHVGRVHCRYGPITRSPSSPMTLSVSFIRFCDSSYGVLTFPQGSDSRRTNRPSLDALGGELLNWADRVPRWLAERLFRRKPHAFRAHANH